MGISRKVLVDERSTLKKTFDDLQGKINLIDKESTALRNNLNAVGGAIQQIDKLLVIDDQMAPSKADSGSLNIAEKEKPKLLNEGEKWKKISTIF